MYNGTNSAEFTKQSGSTTAFTGTKPDGTDTYYGVYPSTIANSSGVLTFDLSAAQVGTSNSIPDIMVASTTNLSQKMTFSHKLTVLKLTLTLPSGVTGTKVTKVTVTGLHNKANYNLSDGTYTYDDADIGDITATNGTTGFTITDSKITAYVSVFPEDVKATDSYVTFTAEVDGKYNYAYTLTSAKTLRAGKVVPVNKSLTKINYRSFYSIEDYYQWDAYSHYVSGSGSSWAEGDELYNPGTDASQSCKDCPSKDEIVNALNTPNGFYWDDGSVSGLSKKSYKRPGNLNSYSQGLWLIKQIYVNSTKETTNPISFTGHMITSDNAASIRASGKYYFLPHSLTYQSGMMNPYITHIWFKKSDYYLIINTSSSQRKLNIVQITNNEKKFGIVPTFVE